MPNASTKNKIAATTINPATNQLLKAYPFQDAVSLDAALGKAARGFKEWRDIAPEERAKMLARLATVLREGSEEYAKLITLEMGKPIAQSREEVEKCAVLCDWFAKHGPELIADETTTVDDNKAYVSYLPLGTVLGIMPWNLPFWQVLRAAVSIMMAGNNFVLSHSTNVTGSALALGDAFQRAGFAPGVFEVIVVPVDALAGIIADQRIAAVTLTGSVRAGIAVGSEAGQALKKCVLELGGSDPFIVLADADLEAAVEAAVRSRYLNTGQVCIAGKRLILEAPIAEAFTSKFVAAAAKLVSGDPMDEKTFLGPMARQDLRESIHQQVTDSVASGARLLLGGKVPDQEGAFYPATVLADVQPGMRAFDEEMFGPVAALTVARDADHAVELANHSDYGLSGNLWTSDIPRGEALARRMETGAVYINGFSASDPRVPIGGVKKSGFGRELGHFGIREFTNAQLVWKDRNYHPKKTNQNRVGFVGFGAMARPMAARLRDAGFEVSAFDPGYQEKEVGGFRLVHTAAALAREVDAVIVSVPADAALEKASEGPGGILEGAKKGLLLINTSTVSPGASKKLAEAAAKKGVRFVEAPLSGSTPEAEKGQLVVLAGGEANDVAAAKGILEVIGRKTVHVGPVGHGLVLKLIINGVMAMGTAALAEGLAYGAKAGVNRDKLIETLQDLILVSEHHRRKLEMAKQGAYPAQFPTKLLTKDLGLLLAETAHHGVPMASMAAAAQLFALAMNQHADEDYAAAISVAEDLAR